MVTITIPAYYWQDETKKRKGKYILISSNWYRNAHYFDKNKCKQHYDELIKLKLKKAGAEKIKGKFLTRYKYFYKNSGSDGSNVVSMAEKFFLDAIQPITLKDGRVIFDGYVEQDSVKYHESDGFRNYRDAKHPRVEIFLYTEDEQIDWEGEHDWK